MKIKFVSRFAATELTASQTLTSGGAINGTPHDIKIADPV